MSHSKDISYSKEKTPRLSSYSVCQYIMSIIFSEGLISLDALLKAIPETSKETLISILEVLHVLGLIQCFTCISGQASSMKAAMATKALTSTVKVVDRPSKKMKKGPTDVLMSTQPSNNGNINSSSSSSSDSSGVSPSSFPVLSLSQKHTTDTYYSVTDFARGTNFTQYRDLVDQIQQKREHKKRLLERIAKLDSLSMNTNYSEAQRTVQLKKLVERYVLEDPNLQHDKLYTRFR